MDIGNWLRSLDLERYEAAFEENEITDINVLLGSADWPFTMSAVCHIGRANRGVEFRLVMETTIVADATITPIRRGSHNVDSPIARAMCLEILFADHTPPLPT